MRELSLIVASGGHSSSWCAGLSLSWPLLLRSTGSRGAGSAIVAHGPSCSAARGIFPDQGSNPCPLHWQADSQPLPHQGSPAMSFFNLSNFIPSSLFTIAKSFPFSPLLPIFLPLLPLFFLLFLLFLLLPLILLSVVAFLAFPRC